jgi:pimeloyl-ACP methyl ester carboxylesterase
MPYIETHDHTQLYYNDWGTGDPVVFLHGWVLGHELWEYQTSTLMHEGCRCIAYDRRGCGRSDQPPTGYDYDMFADDLASVLDGLDLRDVTLVGHSLAGGEIARYASRHGLDRVGRVVFVATTTPFMLQTADNPAGVPKEFFDATVAGLRDDRPRFMTLGAPGFFGAASVSEELVQWGVGLALRASPIATTEMIRAMSETDFRTDLKAVDVPALVIHGAADASSPIELTARRTAETISGSRLEIYETGHGLMITEKARLNHDLLAFIRTER